MTENELAAAADRERAGYLRLALVSSAEDLIRSRYSHHLDLIDNMAWRRVEAAEIRLRAAQAVSDRPEISAAENWLRQCHAAAIHASAQAVIEHSALARARLQCDEELRDQRQRMIDAVDAASAPRPDQDGPSGRGQLSTGHPPRRTPG